ncbi:MAG: GGDEF domain-containing protein [Candidatus Eisenbacteria bacterium]
MSSANQDPECEPILQRILEEIIPVFEAAVMDDSAIFQNPHLQRCWERSKCDRKHCPAFQEEPIRCWQLVGTFCGGKVQGQFVEKYATCKACPTFREACPTLVEELGDYLNNMLFLLRTQKRRAQEATRKSEHLNKELISALENLDLRNREIQEIMTTDRLTGLYNRNYLFTMLEDEFARAARRKEYTFSLLMIDIDDFKGVNDTFGHSNGDTMLSRFGILLRDGIRKFDRAFRYGGEEFVVVLPDTELTVACLVAERIRCAFEKETFAFVAAGTDKPADVSRTLSIGAVAPSPETTAETLLAQAAEAMYVAKIQGKNRVVRFVDLQESYADPVRH